MKYQLVIPAGGTSLRMREVAKDVHKSMLPLDGESMIERLIKEYCEAGVRRVVVLTGKHEESLREHLDHLCRLMDEKSLPIDIDLLCSNDPPVGKAGSAGAILNALHNNTIDDSMASIVHNPDDLILRPSFAEMFLSEHIENMSLGAMASIVLVSSIELPFSIAQVANDRRVIEVEKYPMLKLPTHVGVTILNPETYPLFEELVEEGKDMSFEPTVLPTLIKKRQVFAITIENDEWIPINDPKMYDVARKRLEK